MRFIKVSALQCDSKGQQLANSIRKEFHLNLDLVGGIYNEDIWLKGGYAVMIEGAFFKNFKIIGKINPEDL
jgi:hypothetical protein